LYWKLDEVVDAALIDADRGNVTLPAKVLDPDKLAERCSCISEVSVDEPLIDEDLTNCNADVSVLDPLTLDAPTREYVPDNVLLVLNGADRANDGDAVSVDEPLRLAALVTLVLGAASLAAIKATVI
jgi:hypothetical protein